jgi:hypothetical protein
MNVCMYYVYYYACRIDVGCRVSCWLLVVARYRGGVKSVSLTPIRERMKSEVGLQMY